ncbi:MAG: LysR family transcriptional regulator [Moraxellaceae bacterium]|nr:MAG: LysR family transcriptional regulator [Moraxellaceae bacterium]
MDSKLSNNTIGSIQLFCKAAELESFSAAAIALGVSPAAVSQSVARIEARLGIRLFVRSTRKIRLTVDGRLYYDECFRALQQIEHAEKLIADNQGSPNGLLRISVPTTYGHCRVMPVIQKYRELYPAVSFEINISNKNIDFIEEGYDLAIRMGEPKDSRLIARTLEDAEVGVYASSSYLKKRGTPKKIQDLAQHDCIQFIMPGSGKPMPWTFYENKKEIIVDNPSQVRFTGDVLGCVTYAAAGGGLVQIYDFIAAQMQYRDLVEVLKPFRGEHRIFSVLYPQHKIVSKKMRSFVDLLVAECSAQR